MTVISNWPSVHYQALEKFRAKLSWCHFEGCADGPWHWACTSWSAAHCQTAQILDSSNTFAGATANKRHEAKRAESGDGETGGWRCAGVPERARKDFGEVREWDGESKSKDVKPTSCKAGWHSKCWRGAFLHSGMFASALVRAFGSCLTVRPAQAAQSFSATERRRFVVPIWAVST